MKTVASDLPALVAAIPVDKLRFLTADRHRAYAAILWTLLGHRRSHEIEVYYDEFMVETLSIVPTVEPGPYTPEAFRNDLKQLENWGNLAPRDWNHGVSRHSLIGACRSSCAA